MLPSDGVMRGVYTFVQVHCARERVQEGRHGISQGQVYRGGRRAGPGFQGRL